MFECPDCGARISERARVCPHCGARPTAWAGAWWLLFGLVGLLVGLAWLVGTLPAFLALRGFGVPVVFVLNSALLLAALVALLVAPFRRRWRWYS